MTEIGKKYKNTHTGRICTIVGKSFYMIAHRNESDESNTYPTYTHYKTFNKHWKAADS